MIKIVYLLCFLTLVNSSMAQEFEGEKLMLAQQMSNKGYEKLQAGDVRGAEILFLNALKLDSRVREAYMNLNSIYKESNMDAATTIMEAASSVFADDDEVWYYLANSYYQQKQFEKAIEAYANAIKYSKVNGEDFGLVWSYYFNKANALAKLNRNKDSIEFYTKAIEFNPENPSIYFNRGMNYLMVKQKDLAKKDWLKAGELGMEGIEEYIDEYIK
ncbi:MAG: tetratricopeptide repeat protein [Bacteroidales bacterium]|nr:tetratricopeptide repeat protein [Bacteroidales bacterium]